MRQVHAVTKSPPLQATLALTAFVGTGCFSAATQAATFDYALWYRAEYSDNITRITDEREGLSELINSVGGQFTFSEFTNSIRAFIQAGATYSNYYHQVYDNQTDITLDAFGEGYLLGQTLSWVAADGFRRLQVDPQQPNTPNNRQNSNAWATGPNVYLRFGPVDTLVLEARYGRAWVETLELDNDRYSGATRWQHRTSDRTTWSLNYELLNVDFVNDVLNTDMQLHNYFIRADVRDSRTQFTVDVGRVHLDRENAEPIHDWLGRLTYSLRSGLNEVTGVQYRREYADTGGVLIPTTAVEPGTPGAAAAGIPLIGVDIVSREPYYLGQVDLYHIRGGGMFPMAFRGFYRTIDYPVLAEDRTEKGAAIDLHYVFSPTLSIQGVAIYEILEFEQAVREDRESTLGASFIYRISPILQLSADYRRFGRDSTAPDGGYRENRYGLTLTYGSRPVGR